MKYAIVVDSACGLTKKQAEKFGWYYLPLYMDIDGVNYGDGVDLDADRLFSKFTLKSEVKTSMFNLDYAQKLFKELSENYDAIIVYPISKFLSNSANVLLTMKEDFPKLKVVNSIQISVLTFLDVVWLDHVLKKDSSKIDEYIDYLEKGGFPRSTTLIPKYNKYLVKGGRLHPAAALVAKMFNITPMIKFEKGELLKEGVGRSFYKTIQKNVNTKFKNFKAPKNHVLKPVVLVAGSTLEDQKTYVENVKNVYKIEPELINIPPVVSIHTGPESYVLVIAAIPEEIKKDVDEAFKNISIK